MSAKIKYGELVYRVAHPIARASDFLFSTHLAGCQACTQRRNRWNNQTLWQIILSFFSFIKSLLVKLKP